MGGDSIEMSQPERPQMPTTATSMQDYIDNYPKLMELQRQYNPQQAGLAYDVAAQYGPQYAQLQKQVNEQLYPQTAGLQEQMAGIASRGMEDDVPPAMQAQYLDRLRSEVGPQAGAGIAGDYVSRNMIAQGEKYKQYYQNLGLSLSGRQPLAQNQAPAYSDAGAGYNYGSVAQGNQANYGTAAGLYGNLYNTNAGWSQQNAMMPYQAAGALMGGGAGFIPSA